MGLEVRYGRGGELRKHWYAALVDSNGRRRVVSLTEPLPARHYPGSLKETGDAIFEASRARAEKELEDFQTEERHKGRADHLIERLIQSKTGRGVEYVRLADLPAAWRALGRESKPGEPWLAWCDTVFARFAAAVNCEHLHEVTPEQAEAYLETVRGVCSRKTQQDVTNLLRSAFRRLLPPGAANPFEGGINRKGHDSDGGTVHRKPFTAGELARLFEAARPDPFLYPLVVCAACTGLRLGDVCGLKWGSVDLRAGVLSAKTSKTGASVQIPIFQTLREVLETALAEREPDAVYVWPDAAKMHKANPTGLTWRFKKLVASIMADPEEAQDALQDAQDAPELVPLAKTLPEVLKAVQAAKMTAGKRAKMIDLLNRYASGQSYRMIQQERRISRGGISTLLHEAQRLAGVRFMPEKAQSGVKDKVARLTRLDAPGRAQRASVSDWHSLRTTWITLALAAGVPIELCRLVTGHQTVTVVLKNYFRPQAAHLRAVLGDKLPDVLTGGAAPRQIGAGGTVAGLARQLKDLSPADRARLAELMRGVEQ